MKPGSCGQIFFSYSTVECIVSWLIRSLAPFRLLSLSVSDTHLHSQHICTQSSLLTAHLTPETSEPWEGQMVDAGWGLVCMCAFLCTSRCENGQHQGGVERKHYTWCCVCVFVYPISFLLPQNCFALPSQYFLYFTMSSSTCCHVPHIC